MGLWDVRGGKTQPVQIEQAEPVGGTTATVE